MITSNRPYLIRALYEWIVDNGLTPYVLINVEIENVHVPTHVIENNKVVLNIAMKAAHDLELANEAISFHGRFAGKSEQIYLPVESVLAIYAAENGEGMAFPEPADIEESLPVEVDGKDEVANAPVEKQKSVNDEPPTPKPGRPSLKVVK